MSQFEKFKNTILSKSVPNDIQAAQLQSFMLKMGFSLHGVKGSHYNYKHKDLSYLLTIPMHKESVKQAYIRMVRDAVREVEKNAAPEIEIGGGR
jgi:predicted RNA binding protein YcfA (HicA-like mRNA interferase family)